MCSGSFAPKELRESKNTNAAINIWPGCGEATGSEVCSCLLLPASCCLPPAACRLAPHGWPKRARYSGEEMNANTISASTKLGYWFSLLSQNAYPPSSGSRFM